MIIAEILRNPTEIIRIALSNYKGKDYLDMRIFYLDDNNEWKPTKKGVTLTPDMLDEAIMALQKAKEEFQKK